MPQPPADDSKSASIKDGFTSLKAAPASFAVPYWFVIPVESEEKAIMQVNQRSACGVKIPCYTNTNVIKKGEELTVYQPPAKKFALKVPPAKRHKSLVAC